jgi:transcription termination factor Rho
MKPLEIKQELKSKSRDELNIIAKKLRIKNRNKLKSDELVSSILEKDNKKILKILHMTWWGKYHNHIYGFFQL